MNDDYDVDEFGCWIWKGKLTPKGYGYIGGYHNRAHRIYYERYVGPIPEGLWVLHQCDVKRCINPKHLYLGTVLDNARDASRRGRLDTPTRYAALCENIAKARIVSLKVRQRNAAIRKQETEKLRAMLRNSRHEV